MSKSNKGNSRKIAFIRVKYLKPKGLKALRRQGLIAIVQSAGCQAHSFKYNSEAIWYICRCWDFVMKICNSTDPDSGSWKNSKFDNECRCREAKLCSAKYRQSSKNLDHFTKITYRLRNKVCTYLVYKAAFTFKDFHLSTYTCLLRPVCLGYFIELKNRICKRWIVPQNCGKVILRCVRHSQFF